MSRISPLLAACLALCLCVAPPAHAGRSGEKRSERAKQGLTPISLGRRASLPPVTRGRAASLPSITRERAAAMSTSSLGRRAGLLPVTRGRAAGLASITRGRAAALSSVSHGRAASLAPVTTGRAAGLLPVTHGRGTAMSAVTHGRAASAAPVTTGRAASLLPISIGRGATLPAVSHGRAAGLSSYTRHLETLVDARAGPSVLAYGDGYLAPFGAKSLVSEGFFEEVLTEAVETPVLSARVERRVTETFREEGLDGLYLYDGSVYGVLDAIDPYGPHRYYRAPLGQDVPPGVRVGGFHFPAAYYVRPIGDASFRYNKGYRLVLVPRDIEEEVPEDFERTLEKSHFPLVIGDMAFKEGSYVQAAIAFWVALDRKPGAVAPHFALADALVALRNYGFATELIRAGLERSPRWADRLDRRGIYGAKDESGFEKHFGEVKLFAQQNLRAPDAWFLYGYLLLTSGDEKRRGAAEEAFRLALRLDPDDELSRRYVDHLSGV